MSVKISQALTAEGVVRYHREEYAANYSSYYNERGQAVGVWFGKEAEAFGLMPGTPVQLEHFERLANGQDPHSGLQLIEWRGAAAEKTLVWMRTDEAWRAHVEKLMLDALAESRDIFRQKAGGEKPERQSLDRQSVSSSVDKAAENVKYTDREVHLLEMHRIARETFATNLASQLGEEARRYIKERGIRLETAKAFGLGLADASGKQLVEKLQHYGPDLMEASGLFVKRGNEFVDRFQNRLMFPIENATGETIAFAGRKHPDDRGPKYINSPQTEIYCKGEQLYNLHRASERIQETGQVVIVEGYLDAIAAYQAGQRNVVAVSGTALSNAQISAIAQRARIAILNLDGDDAGKIAAEKHLSALLDRGIDVRVVEMPSDPADWIIKNGVKEYRKQLREVPPLISYLSDRSREEFDISHAEGKADAIRWMISTLEHVQPAHRERITAEVEAYLQTPKATAEEAKQSSVSEHRAAWDVTFGAPKTVSLTALVGGDDRIVKAHDEAVREGMGYFERAIQVKMGGLNAPQTTGRMVATLFRHDTSRPVKRLRGAALAHSCGCFQPVDGS